MSQKKKAVICVSGGLDSATCLAIAKSQGFECYALSFDYGQRHNIELKAASKIATILGAAQHKTIKLGVGELKGSALTDSTLTVPEYTGSKEIPITYVPARNTQFLAVALAWAEILEAYDIFIGVSSIDYSHYPDCRPAYIEAFQKLARLATKAGVEGQEFTIHAPLLVMSKAETIQAGIALGVDYSQTISCYSADDLGRACGICDSCTFRKKGFAEAGVVDPTHYI